MLWSPTFTATGACGGRSSDIALSAHWTTTWTQNKNILICGPSVPAPNGDFSLFLVAVIILAGAEDPIERLKMAAEHGRRRARWACGKALIEVGSILPTATGESGVYMSEWRVKVVQDVL